MNMHGIPFGTTDWSAIGARIAAVAEFSDHCDP
jgi:hypothetical protein